MHIIFITFLVDLSTLLAQVKVLYLWERQYYLRYRPYRIVTTEKIGLARKGTYLIGRIHVKHVTFVFLIGHKNCSIRDRELWLLLKDS